MAYVRTPRLGMFDGETVVGGLVAVSRRNGHRDDMHQLARDRIGIQDNPGGGGRLIFTIPHADLRSGAPATPGDHTEPDHS